MNIIKWGNNHEKHFRCYETAKNFAYQKAFYFEVFLNGLKINRQF